MSNKNKNKIVLFASDLKYGGVPLSLLSITSLLDASKYDIRIITHMEYPDYKSEVLKQCDNALCFGVTCITGEPIKISLAISKVVREKYPFLPIIWGGWQAITLPEETLNSTYVDYLCTGQGERTFSEFINMIEDNNYENISNIYGLSYKRNGINIHNPKRELEGLNHFPDFNFNLIDWEKYLEVVDFGTKALRIITSYGCPNCCSFCCELYNTNRRWKALSAERIILFLKKLRSMIDFDSLIISDSNFFVSERRVVEFCNGLIKNNFNIRYGSVNGTADVLVRYNKSTWKLLKQTGLSSILVGIESANNQTLKFIKKRATVKNNYQLAEICVRYGIKLVASTIIGLPILSYFSKDKQRAFNNEFKELTELYKHLYELDPNIFFVLFFYSPLPSTPLYNKAIELGFNPPKNLSEWSSHDLEAVHFSWITKNNIAKRRTLNYVSVILSKDLRFFNRQLPWILRIFIVPTFGIIKPIARLRLKFNYYNFPIDVILFNAGLKLFHKINHVLRIMNVVNPCPR